MLINRFEVKINNPSVTLEDEARNGVLNWFFEFNVAPYGRESILLMFDDVEGEFVSNDGNIRHLTGGRGTMSIRQWHQYPSILPRELYSDEKIDG